ncbi:malto-oligosyltrehalose trehalohydrolase, partial [Cutibacterium acnes subsp. acnes]|nr:malto-oligosyltrehalose trehalohydrolase [Cutibacterium acnes subsp. acnes]
ALVLQSPNTPKLFKGEEWGTPTPIQFFTDHEEEDQAPSVSQGRAREFAGFGWNADEIPDPQDAATVETSRLDWSELDQTEHTRMLAWYRALTA